MLIKKRKSTGFKHFNDTKPFIEYSNDMGNRNIKEHNPKKKPKILIVFDDMIADMLNNKKRNPIVTEFLIKDIKLNISFVFIRQTYFAVSKNIKLHSTYYFIMKIPNKRELQ